MTNQCLTSIERANRERQMEAEGLLFLLLVVGYVGRQAEKHPKVNQNVTFFHCENGTFYRKSNDSSEGRGGKADCSCSNLELILKRLSSGLSSQG